MHLPSPGCSQKTSESAYNGNLTTHSCCTKSGSKYRVLYAQTYQTHRKTLDLPPYGLPQRVGWASSASKIDFTKPLWTVTNYDLDRQWRSLTETYPMTELRWVWSKACFLKTVVARGLECVCYRLASRERADRLFSVLAMTLKWYWHCCFAVFSGAV